MPDHAAQAIRAALEMRERLEEFNAERREAPPLQIRIGINSGKVVAGEIGSVNKKEYTVLGDAVNIASRLESSVAKPMMIVIGENTFEAVQGQFECRSLGQTELKGKAKKVAASTRWWRPRPRSTPRRPAPPPAGPDEGRARPAPRRRGRILFSLLLLLLASAWCRWWPPPSSSCPRSREILELDQKAMQLDKARSLSQQVAVYVGSLRSQVAAIARTLEMEAADRPFSERVARCASAARSSALRGRDRRPLLLRHASSTRRARARARARSSGAGASSSSCRRACCAACRAGPWPAIPSSRPRSRSR